MKNILLLCDFNFRYIGTVKEHIDAFSKYSKNNIITVDSRSFASTQSSINSFDVLILHYSLVISLEYYIPSSLRKKITDFAGYKILFIQDEYRFVNKTVEAMSELGVNLLYSVINPESIDKVYHHSAISHVKKKTTLTGYVSSELVSMAVPKYEDRSIDVGYRARKLPSWLGSFALDKWQIGKEFLQNPEVSELTCDIESDESKRIYGDKWLGFVSSCKAMLGTESGSSFIDFTGEIQPRVESYEESNSGVKFSVINEKFLNGKDGEIVIHVISPRCFEAAVMRTLMIMYPGDYSGILKPWRHYVPLERDHSNISEVVSLLKSPARAKEIIDYAYKEIAKNPKYSLRVFIESFDQNLSDELGDSVSGEIDEVLIGELRDLEKKTLRKYKYNRYIKEYLIYKITVFVVSVLKFVFPKKWHKPLLNFARKVKRAILH